MIYSAASSNSAKRSPAIIGAGPYGLSSGGGGRRTISLWRGDGILAFADAKGCCCAPHGTHQAFLTQPAFWAWTYEHRCGLNISFFRISPRAQGVSDLLCEDFDANT
jgi:hypothetical protein